MAKKLAVLMTLVCIGLGAVVVNYKIQGDNQGPEITFRNAVMSYNADMTEAELLEDAVAIDAVEGDVSAMTVIENIYKISDEQVVVVYVAKDSRNNITKVKRPLMLEEKNEVKEEEITPTPITTFGLTDADAAKETENDETADAFTEETTESLTEEAAEAERARTEQEAVANTWDAASPKVYLTDYWIEVPVGTTIDALSYVKEIVDDTDDVYELWKKIQLRDEAGNQASSAISCSMAGTYKYTFLVVDSQNHVSNSAVLTIVVK